MRVPIPEPDLDDDTMIVPRRHRDASPSPHVGHNLGRYLVIDELGRGGMGVVLRAYDPKLQREVALKCIRPDLGGEDAKLALVREAQSMAKLAHPNVVSVYDVEMDGDTVVLAMEYVDGEILTDWLDRQPRTWEEIVELFVGAGRGLEAAHRAGLLHRDFKPGNVIVGGDDRAKVMDFGLARIEEGRSGRLAPSVELAVPNLVDDGTPLKADALLISLSTQHPTQPITDGETVKGTPAYMAPEQHQLGVLTPAIDQFAFCVSLWQALTGQVPFPTIGRTMAGLLAAKQAGAPPWPKQIEVPRTIVDALTRGLSPDARDRWPSMTELLARLARDPHRGRRTLAWGIAGATLVAASATALFVWQQNRAALCGGARAQLDGIWDDERRASARAAILGTELSYAPGVWERVEPAIDGYAERWIATHQDACEATALRGEQSTALLDLRMNCLRKAKVELAATVTALVEADRRTVEKAHGLVSGLPRIEQCDDLDALQAEVAPPRTDEERERVRSIEATLATARTQLEVGSYDRAMATITGVAPEVEALDYGPIRTSWALASGNAHEGVGDYDAAVAAHLVALQSGLQWRQWMLASRAARELTFEVGGLLHRHAEGLAYAQTALGLARGIGVAAEASAKSSLASIYNGQGKPAEAEAELREALALWDEAPTRDEMGVASSRSNLAVVLAAQGKLEESEQELRAALEVYDRELGPEHPSVASMRNNLAVVLRNRGNFVGAEAEQRRVIELYERAFGRDHPNIASSRSNLAVTLESQGRFAEAEAETRRALAIYEQTLGAEHVDVASARANLGGTLRSLGRLDEAEAVLRESLAVLQEKLPADHPKISFAWNGLGLVLLDARRSAEAAEAFEHALRIRNAAEVAPVLRADSTTGLARALWPEAGQRERARELRRSALELYREADDPDADGLRELEAWIAAEP